MNGNTPLTAVMIRELLGSDSFIKQVEVIETIDSTNLYARNLVANGLTEPGLVIAEEQTAGRGRRGRRWQSEKGKNLLFSLVVAPSIRRERLGILPLCVAECVARAVQLVSGISLETKWPNDLLAGGRKVCGILIESGRAQDIVVIGIGLNVNQTSFPPDLRASSLALVTGGPIDRLALLAAILSHLAWLNEPASVSRIDELLAAWRSRCTIFGGQVRVQTAHGEVMGIAQEVAWDGGLLLMIDGKEKKILAGDVSPR